MNHDKPKYIYYDLSLLEQYPDLTAIDNLILCRIKGFAEKYGQYNLPLSDLVECTRSSADTVRRSLRRLLDLGLITESQQSGKATAYIPPSICDPSQNATPRKMRPDPSQNATPNNKIIINKNNRESIEAAPKKSKFQKPTIEQIAAYCQERQNGIDAEAFFYFYESKGWLVGKTPMKDWQAAIRTWEQKRKNETNHGNNNPRQAATTAANPTEAKPYSRIQQLGDTRFNLK